MKKFIVIQPYYDKIFINIVKDTDEEHAAEGFENNYTDPIVLDLKTFQKSYKKALKEDK
jgi:hypothetical protein